MKKREGGREDKWKTSREHEDDTKMTREGGRGDETRTRRERDEDEARRWG